MLIVQIKYLSQKITLKIINTIKITVTNTYLLSKNYFKDGFLLSLIYEY